MLFYDKIKFGGESRNTALNFILSSMHAHWEKINRTLVYYIGNLL